MKKKCFVICALGDDDSPLRRHAEQVIRHIVRGSLEPDYEVNSALDGGAGMIMQYILDHLKNDDLVIADLTSHNPNVFYELGIRHAIRKPVIQLIDNKDSIPFDIRDTRTISFDLTNPDSIDDARSAIKNHLDGIESGDLVVSPLDVHVYLEDAAKGDDQVSKAISALSDRITGLSADMQSMMTSSKNNLTVQEPLAYPNVDNLSSHIIILTEELRSLRKEMLITQAESAKPSEY